MAMGETTIHFILIQVICHFLENCVPGLKKIIGTVTVSSKGHLTILSIQLLQDDEEYGKTSGFLECGPTSTFLHFSDCEVSSLIKSNIMWNQYYNDG